MSAGSSYESKFPTRRAAAKPTLNTTAERYRSFWTSQQRPLNRSEEPEYYRQVAKELRLLWDGLDARKVLEIGCAQGAMFPFLGFEEDGYTGVDFAVQFIDQFRAKYPDLRLECCDGSSYIDDETYDLIFSNGVIQHFDDAMLEAHFRNARAMMHPGGVLVCASVPWKRHRLRYFAGHFGSGKPGLVRALKSWAGERLGVTRMGRWYDTEEIARFARAQGFAAQFYGSLSSLYRFHAVLRIKESRGNDAMRRCPQAAQRLQ
jgi:2-polyprenyl-3-methyl-5-hydroxy-6-metoxy-1,4-benzoquinol methylase